MCLKTIYRWLYADLLVAGEVTPLRHKGKRRKPVETRGRFLVGTPTNQRPKEVRKRETFDHWELDTVVSSRGKSKVCAATFIERKTRMYVAIKMPDRTAHSMETAFGNIRMQLFRVLQRIEEGICLLYRPRERSYDKGLLRRPLFFLATRVE